MNISLRPCSRLRIWSRDTGSAVLFRVGLRISIPRLNLVLRTVLNVPIFSFKISKFLDPQKYGIDLVIVNVCDVDFQKLRNNTT